MLRAPIELTLAVSSDSGLTKMTVWRKGDAESYLILETTGTVDIEPVRIALPYPPIVKGSLSCPYCRGKGEVYLFKDRDPIEGSKMQSPVTCTVCEGAGRLFPGNNDAVIYLDQLRTFYEQVNDKIRGMTRDARAQRRAEVISRLSAEDREILGVGINE